MTTRYLRLKQIIGDLTATPPIPPIIPISRSCWYAGIKTASQSNKTWSAFVCLESV